MAFEPPFHSANQNAMARQDPAKPFARTPYEARFGCAVAEFAKNFVAQGIALFMRNLAFFLWIRKVPPILLTG
jgi:hypothetical protein